MHAVAGTHQEGAPAVGDAPRQKKRRRQGLTLGIRVLGHDHRNTGGSESQKDPHVGYAHERDHHVGAESQDGAPDSPEPDEVIPGTSNDTLVVKGADPTSSNIVRERVEVVTRRLGGEHQHFVPVAGEAVGNDRSYALSSAGAQRVDDQGDSQRVIWQRTFWDRWSSGVTRGTARPSRPSRNVS